MGRSSFDSEMERWGEAGYVGDESGIRIKPAGGRKFIAIRWDDIHAATGEDHGPRHVFEVVMVDLDAIGEENIASALRSCGPGEDEELPDIGVAEACISYGCHAPLASHEGGNRRALFRAARQDAETFIEDEDALEDRLDGAPVNAMGSTPREFMRGDFDSALARGLAKGDRSAGIVAQMQAPIPRGVALQASVTLQDDSLMALSNGDPLAYTMGFMDGFQGREMPEAPEGDSLADAYVKGREHGADVRLGRQPKPDWIN